MPTKKSGRELIDIGNDKRYEIAEGQGMKLEAEF
jgi:hypothetical protein